MAKCFHGFSAGVLLLSWCLPTHAQQAAHVHGSATLNLVIDNGALEIELESPAANIVGFEHEAESEADINAIKAALQTLRDPDALFALPESADCELEEVEAELHGHDDEHGDDHQASHDEHGHDEAHDDEEGHDDEHGHDDEQGHDDDHDQAGHEEHGDEHSEFHAHYHFECANSAALNEITLPLFQRFPAIEEIHLQAITPWGQFGGNIEPRDAKIELK